MSKDCGACANFTKFKNSSISGGIYLFYLIPTMDMAAKVSREKDMIEKTTSIKNKSKEYQMRHCSLEKKIEKGIITTASWIPDKFAVLNKVVKLKRNEIWDDGWIVKSVSSFSRSSSEVNLISKQWRNHRSVSDI